MAHDEWAEYLEEAKAHVRACRVAVEHGWAIPDAPPHPTGPLPDHWADRARLVAASYDQLALEVATRMDDLRGSTARRGPMAPAPGPRFVDRLV